MPQHTDGSATGRARSLWVTGLQTLGVAVVANMAVRAAALAFLTIPPEFPPLATVGPTIIFTVIGVAAAVGVYALVRRMSKRPDDMYRLVAVVALLISFVPDAWLMTGGGGEAFPGATRAAVGVLIVMHIVTATVVVSMLTGSGDASTT